MNLHSQITNYQQLYTPQGVITVRVPHANLAFLLHSGFSMPPYVGNISIAAVELYWRLTSNLDTATQGKLDDAKTLIENTATQVIKRWPRQTTCSTLNGAPCIAEHALLAKIASTSSHMSVESGLRSLKDENDPINPTPP